MKSEREKEREKEPQREALEKRYAPIINEDLDLGPYVSFSKNSALPFLHLYRYEEAYSFFLVEYLLQSCGATETAYVIDPFCGSGITLFTSCVKGIPSVGMDTSPFACFLSQTLPLFLNISEGTLRNTWKILRRRAKECDPAPIGNKSVINQAFHEKTLLILRKIKTAISTLSFPYSDIFLYLFFSILEECSTFSRLKREWTPVKGKNPSDPFSAMERKVGLAEQDLKKTSMDSIDRVFLPKVHLMDSTNSPWRDVLSRDPTILITSPPYADAVDYAETYAVELGFLRMHKRHECRTMKQAMVRSYPSSHALPDSAPHSAVEEICDALHTTNPSSPFISMIQAYFNDMKKGFTTWHSQLSSRARVAMVLKNLRYHGQYIPVDLIVCDMAEEIGFTIDNIVVTRYRKEREPGTLTLRESILFWEKP